MRLEFEVPLCLKNMAFSKCFITVSISAPILTNAKNIENIYIFKIVQIFVSYGIKKVLTQIMTLNQLIFLPQW